LSRAGARRILLTLQTLGYVSSDGRLFKLTPRILDLGFAYLSSMPMWNLAEPEMQALAARVGESCSAAMLDGADIVYVLRVPTHKIMSISLGVGSRLPAHCTSLGRMLLAGLSDDEVLSLLHASDRSALTRHTVTEPEPEEKNENKFKRACNWCGECTWCQRELRCECRRPCCDVQGGTCDWQMARYEADETKPDSDSGGESVASDICNGCGSTSYPDKCKSSCLVATKIKILREHAIKN
jgi:hypothetical protein